MYNIEQVTNGSVVNGAWTGPGIFDVLMDAVTKNIDIQHAKNLISGKDYAQVYLGAMQAVLQQSIAYAIQHRDMVEKELSGAKQREVLDAQKDLYTRQKESFDDNKYQKVLEAQMNYNAMTYADTDKPTIPDIARNNLISDIYNRIVSGSPTSVIPE